MQSSLCVFNICMAIKILSGTAAAVMIAESTILNHSSAAMPSIQDFGADIQCPTQQND